MRGNTLFLCAENKWARWLDPTQVTPLLKDDDDDVRRFAVFVLGRMGKDGAAFANLVVPLLKDTDPWMRQAAEVALGEMVEEGAAVAAQIVPLLKDTDPWVRRYAADVLGQMGKEGAAFAEQVVPLLKDTHDIIRRSAAEALGQMGSEGAAFAEQVVPLLKDADPFVRGSAANALGQMGREGAALAAQVAPLLKDADHSVRRSAAKTLAQMGKEGATFVAQLVPLFMDTDGDVRRSAAEALGQLGKQGAAVATLVVPLLKHPDPWVRCSAAYALGQMGKEGAAFAAQVAPMLNDTDWVVRSYAAEALGQMGKEGAAFVAQLVPLLMDTDDDVRRSAAKALGQMGKEGASFVAQLVPLLMDADDDVRRSAAEALEQMGKEDAAVAVQVVPLLKDADPYVRGSAAEALGQMGKEDAAVVAQVALLLRDTDSTARHNAARALGRMGKEGAAFAAQVAPLLKDTDWVVRRYAAEALGQMGKEGAAFVAQLVPLLMDTDDDVRRSAAEALGQMGKEGAAFAAQVVPLLKHPDTYVRRSAAEALGQMGGEGAAFSAQVLPLLKDTDKEVRRYAAKALVHMGNQSDVAAVRNELLVSAMDALHVIDVVERHRLRAHLRIWCGGHPELQLALDWLADPEYDPIPPNRLPSAELLELLGLFSELWDHTDEFSRVQSVLATRIAEVVTAVPAVPDAELETLLGKLRDQTASNPVIQQAIAGALNRIETGKWVRRVVIAVGIHLSCWLLLLLAYPRSVWVQTFCFWNPWFRKFLGFPYVGLVLRYVPLARRRLFAPFADVLVADARLAQLDDEQWFPDCTVRDLDVDPRQQKSLPLTEAVPNLHGQIVLIGESGLGKTMYLRRLVQHAVNSGRIAAYLPAEDCSAGVIEALKSRLEGPAKDHAFLRDLVFAGAIDIGIDGLNQVPPDTRAQVSQFMSRFVRGNIMVTTQPMEWRAPQLARRYRLEPLEPDKIGSFLKSREPLLPEDAKLSGEPFQAACDKYVAEVLEAAYADAAELATAREVLSNPLDATVAAEILGGGVTPDLLDLRAQQYEAMATEYRDEVGANFPLDALAEAAYDMRVEGTDLFPKDKFPRELSFLARHRLLVRRQSRVAGDGEKQEWWVFRHDKFLEFFVVHAFIGADRARREEHLGDPPFRGVYLRLGEVLPTADAADLREQFIRYAAKTDDNSTSNEYIRILIRRGLQTPPATGYRNSRIKAQN